MTIIDGTKQCPKCGRYPKFTIMGKGNRNNRRLEYGMLCSNSECSWSYFSIMYESRDKAIAEWNKKVMRHQESKTNTPWHTGTPTEGGLFLVLWNDTEEPMRRYSILHWNEYNGTWYDEETPSCNWGDEYHAEVIAWIPITPYEEN